MRISNENLNAKISPLILVNANTSLAGGVEPTHQQTEAQQSESKSSKILERNRERRKVVSANLEDLTECEEEEEEEDEDLSVHFSTSPLSSLSSFKNKFHFSLSGKNKVGWKSVGKINFAWLNSTLLAEFFTRSRTGPETFNSADVTFAHDWLLGFFLFLARKYSWSATVSQNIGKKKRKFLD